jgi:hypothetical protein
MAVTFMIDRADDRGIAMTCVREQNNTDEACRIAGESPHFEIGGATEVRIVGMFPKPR